MVAVFRVSGGENRSQIWVVRCRFHYTRGESRHYAFMSTIIETGTSQKVGEIEDLPVADQVKNIRHRGIVAAARVVLVFPQRLDEVVLALAGEAGNILFTGIIPVMAEVTSVLLDECPGPFHAGGISGVAGGPRRRQLRKVGRHIAQIVVPESSHHLVHRFDDAQPFPKHEQLDGEVESRLTAERGHFGNCRLPFLAVAGEAWGEPRLKRIRAGWQRRQQNERSAYDATPERLRSTAVAREEEGSRATIRPPPDAAQRAATLALP